MSFQRDGSKRTRARIGDARVREQVVEQRATRFD